MKKVYLILVVLGFILPNSLVLLESVETGNFLLYAHPMSTLNGMFANRISTIFLIDLLFSVVVFFIWIYQENKKHKIPQASLICLLTLLFGLAGALPLFLYFREDSR